MERINILTFSNCIGLTSVTIPESVKIIDEQAFIYCLKLADISVPAEIQEIGEEVFLNVSATGSIKITGDNGIAKKDLDNLRNDIVSNSNQIIVAEGKWTLVQEDRNKAMRVKVSAPGYAGTVDANIGTLPIPAVSASPEVTASPVTTMLPQMTSNPEPSISPCFGKLKLAESKNAQTAISIKWTKVKNADGYHLYSAKWNADKKLCNRKQVADILDGGITTWTSPNLKKGTRYLFQVEAYKIVDGKKVILSKSVEIQQTTKGGKYGTVESVQITKIGNKKIKSKNNISCTLKKVVNIRLQLK